jgi:hypothetical protein
VSRVLHLDMSETEALKTCETASVGVSAVEKLPAGGIRLVCMSSDGAETLRTKLKKKLITGDVVRQATRLQHDRY